MLCLQLNYMYSLIIMVIFEFCLKLLTIYTFVYNVYLSNIPTYYFNNL